MAHTQPVIPRLLSKISLDENGCWLWTGSKRNGYGEFWRNNRRLYAHRVAFEAFVRPLNPGEVVCHKCDVPPCVNPDHLFAGTQADNVRDMHAKGRAGGQFGSPSRADWNPRRRAELRLKVET